jgi:N-hydroxyarylamine O-acetyltransferase
MLLMTNGGYTNMVDINGLYRKRIGFLEKEKMTFETLASVLEKTAKTIPFENLCVINKNVKEITRENLIDKILVRNEGGLCYELNPILYFFLKENGFEVIPVRGVTYNTVNRSLSPTGRTHVINILTYNQQKYVVDTGFGGNLPLRPVSLNGDVVTSSNGDFRISKVDGEFGDHLFEMKVKHKSKDWVKGYAFDSTRFLKDERELNEIQKIIVESPVSPFNKSYLVTRLSDNGNLTLTETSFTQWTNGSERKEVIDRSKFKELAKQHFDLVW